MRVHNLFFANLAFAMVFYLMEYNLRVAVKQLNLGSETIDIIMYTTSTCTCDYGIHEYLSNT